MPSIPELDERPLPTSDYLDAHGTPKSADELRDHRILVWDGPGRSGNELPLADGSKLPISPALRRNDIVLLRQAALHGIRIAFVPDGPVPLEFLGGDKALVRVLETEVVSKTTIWLLAPHATLQAPNSDLILEHLTRLLGGI